MANEKRTSSKLKPKKSFIFKLVRLLGVLIDSDLERDKHSRQSVSGWNISLSDIQVICKL